jgi:A/G-specific adenine glycosylase
MDCIDTSLASKRNKFRTAIRSWSGVHARQFAWRSLDRGPYDILVAEVLLKRTTAEAASRIYDSFLDKYPDLTALGRATEEELATELRSLGLYSQRAKGLVKLVRYLTAKEGGLIPDTFDRLMRVPGLGNYSARAILSFAYGKPAAVVDTNVVRVLGRVFHQVIPAQPSTNLMQKTADSLIPRTWHRQFNFAMLDLGRLICRSSKPICNSCPLSDICDHANHRGNPNAALTILAKQVLEWRRRQGLSLVALAQRAGVSKMTVINIEAGRTTPRPGTIKKLADALGVNAESLTG